MSIDVNATFAKEQVKREGIGIAEMYILNASHSGFDPLYFVNWNQNVIGFQLNASGDLEAADETYTGVPIKREPVKTNLQGEASGVSISIPNVDRGLEAYVQNRNYLRGCDVYILTAFTKHLPSGASANHIGESPDRFAVLKEVLQVDSLTSDENVVAFTCRPKFLISKKVLPGRSFSRGCSWAEKGRYVGIECDPTAQINTTTYPECDGTLDNCTERTNKERFGGFPSVPDRGVAIV
jgi:phage-related protein